jgi:uncharacterized protein (TIGR02271 family)
MITTEQVDRLVQGNATVVGVDGEKIGTVGQVYLDDQTGQPEWVTAKTGLFGTSETFIPLRDATLRGDDVQVPYGKDKVKEAPRIDDTEGHLSPDEEAELYRYYGLGFSDTRVDTGVATEGRADDARGTVGRDTSGPTTDDAMTRSEERLHVGTESQETGRARLRKYVVTENVSQTVPVSHDEVRLEREPITEANVGAAMSGPDISEEEHEVTLEAERPVVQKETVPVERVRLDKETVTENVSVNDEVRKEQIELDDNQR